MSKHNGFSKLPHGFHKRLHELTEAELKVWLAHRCMEGKAGTSYPSRETLAGYTGLNVQTISDARTSLRAKSWLVVTGYIPPKKRGQFSVPIEHTEVPQSPCVENLQTVEPPTDSNVCRKPTLGIEKAVCMSTVDGRTVDGSAVDGLPTAEVDPSFEVDPKKEVHPSNPPSATGLGGGMKGGENPLAGNDDSPLTESLMLDAIQRAHSETRNEWNDRRMGSYESVPVVPNLAKSKELFDELWRRGIRTVNQLPVVRAAYKNWFEAVYLASFDEAANDVTTVRQPIRYALAVFRKEAGLFLDQAREEMQDGLEPEEAA
jgi:hypothetical protein